MNDKLTDPRGKYQGNTETHPGKRQAIVVHGKIASYLRERVCVCVAGFSGDHGRLPYGK